MQNDSCIQRFFEMSKGGSDGKMFLKFVWYVIECRVSTFSASMTHSFQPEFVMVFRCLVWGSSL